MTVRLGLYCLVLGLISLLSSPADAAPVEVFASVDPAYTIKRDKDSHFLGTQMGVRSPNAEADSQRIITGRAGGTNTATIDRSIEIDLDYVPESERIRVKVRGARVHFHYRNIILHIASDLPGCFDQLAINHELRHVQVKREVLADYESRFRNSLTAILDKTDGKLIATNSIESYQADLYASAYTAIDAVVMAMYRDVDVRDIMIDDVAAVMREYNAARQTCR